MPTSCIERADVFELINYVFYIFRASWKLVILVIPVIVPTFSLSLGRVDPAPHTQRLWRPFAAIAQNSLLRSLSIVDSFACKQHDCRRSEELAIRKSARFRATPSSYQHSELLRVGGAQELRATSQASELLRATRSGGAQELRATQSQSELLQCFRALLRAKLELLTTPSTERSYRAPLRSTRLCHAITYASCQGLTLRGRVCDADNPHFSVKHLYVGASRCTGAAAFSALRPSGNQHFVPGSRLGGGRESRPGTEAWRGWQGFGASFFLESSRCLANRRGAKLHQGSRQT